MDNLLLDLIYWPYPSVDSEIFCCCCILGINPEEDAELEANQGNLAKYKGKMGKGYEDINGPLLHCQLELFSFLYSFIGQTLDAVHSLVQVGGMTVFTSLMRWYNNYLCLTQQHAVQEAV